MATGFTISGTVFFFLVMAAVLADETVQNVKHPQRKLPKGVRDGFCSPYGHKENAHAHDMRDVVAKNLSCGDMTRAVLWTKMVKEYIDDWKENYTQVNFNWSWDKANEILNRSYDYKTLEICETCGSCQTVLPTLPTPPPTSPTTDDLLDVLGYIQCYLVAFESLILDQSLFADKFLSETARTHVCLETLEFYLSDPVATCDLEPHQDLLHDLSRWFYKGEDDLMRRLRGFAAIRQTIYGLQYLLDVFEVKYG